MYIHIEKYLHTWQLSITLISTSSTLSLLILIISPTGAYILDLRTLPSLMSFAPPDDYRICIPGRLFFLLPLNTFLVRAEDHNPTRLSV